MLNFFAFFRKKKKKEKDAFDLTQKYYSFKNLLLTNNELLDLFAQLQKKISKVYINIPLFRSLVYKILDTTFGLIQNLNEFTDDKYRSLYDVFLKLDKKIRDLLEVWKPISVEHLTIPITEINIYLTALVGGKAAHLGEVKTALNLPVPNGFAITTTAFKKFIDFNNLKDVINQELSDLSPEDLAKVDIVSQKLKSIIKKSRIPPELEVAINEAWSDLSKQSGFSGRVAVRSSAYGEDAHLSFAGQFTSVLNVNKQGLIDAYKEVLASKYCSRAIIYRLQKGIKDEEMPMAVLVIEMIDTKAAGVIYTRNPNCPQEDTMLITSSWGLGEYVVQGKISTDYFQVSRTKEEVVSHIAKKEKMLVLGERGVEEKEIPLERQEKPSLTLEEIKLLKQYALILEDYFGSPQDIEYAIDKEHKIFILQTRPLKVLVRTARETTPQPENKILLKGLGIGTGAATGPVFILNGRNLDEVPEGAILVARHGSPELTAVMSRVAGIIVDLGNPSGHMATVARESKVPTVLGTGKATSILKNGQILTIDGDSGVVYEGRVEALLKIKQETEPIAIKNPEYKRIKEIIDLIIPLNLIDPRNASFSPKHCKTVHDIVRFIHEMSIQEMFNLGDRIVSTKRFKVVRLISPLPVPVFMIDLGGGISEKAAKKKTIQPEDVVSIPFQALWRGMSHPKIRWSGPIGVSIQGFMSVLMRSMIGAEGQLGEPSYAIVSKEYLNFNIRLAYHYSLIDTFCSDVVNSNYINFRFFGGGASSDRRSLRAKCIEGILKDFGFAVIREGDLINAWFKKYPRKITEEKLDMLGRLMGFTRQIDMLMENEEVCYVFADIFKKGAYDTIYQEGFLNKYESNQKTSKEA
ncbi:MAG: hypothetical protein LWW94_03460 [Candidatus Desulfofervidaceae bacterium]|nr:hypothetical protein [Candidatus Desulfofervidaceae bacterium]